jgi:hypothetical protein
MEENEDCRIKDSFKKFFYSKRGGNEAVAGRKMESRYERSCSMFRG